MLSVPLPAARTLALCALTTICFAAPRTPAEFEPKAGTTLRVLVGADEPPEMFSFKSGTPPGMAREMIEGFARLHRMTLQVVPVTIWDDIIPALNRGEGDVITGIMITDARRKLVDFTAETLPSRHLAVTRAPRPAILSLADLRAARVGVIRGTSWADAAVEAGVPASQLEHLPSLAALVAALKARKVDALVMSIVDFTLAQKRDPELQAGMFLGKPTSAAWAVRKEDTALRNALDEYIENQRRSSGWSKIVVKYFGLDALAVLGRAKQE